MTKSIHNRECPKCGVIVEWTKGKEKQFETYSGITVTARPMLLICPKHGRFEPRAHEQLNRDLSRVMKEIDNRD